MRRHHGHERIQLKIKIRMSGRDQLMIHKLLRISQMAGEAFFTTLDKIPRVIHAQIERLLVLPVARGMGPEPSRGRSMAILAADAIGEIERAGAHIQGHVQSVAGKAPGRRVRLRQTHDFRHSRANRICEIDERMRVFIANHPGAVLVLEHRRVLARLHTAVTSRRTARSRPGVLRRLGSVGGEPQSVGDNEAKSARKTDFHY